MSPDPNLTPPCPRNSTADFAFTARGLSDEPYWQQLNFSNM
jgi:hypothetical protein